MPDPTPNPNPTIFPPGSITPTGPAFQTSTPGPRVQAIDDTTPVSYTINNVAQWAQALLAYMHLPVTQSNIAFLVGWANREGGNWHNTARYNPLNTTLRYGGSTVMGGGNSAGVQAYSSWQVGLEATAQTLNGYGGIVAALKSGDASSADASGRLSGDLLKWSGNGYAQIAPASAADMRRANETVYPDPAAAAGAGTAAQPGTGDGAGAGGGGGAAMQTPATLTIGQLGIAQAQQQYPELAWMLNIPDAAADIYSFAAQHYTPDEIAARLQGKPWYQRIGASFFTWIAQQATNPTQAAQTFKEELAAITQTFAQLGLKPSDQQLQTFAYQALAQDWQNHPELQQQAIADLVHANPDGTFSVKNYSVDSSGRLVNTFIGPDGQASGYVWADYQTKLPTSSITAGLVTKLGTVGKGGKYTGEQVAGGAPVYAEVGGQLVQGFDLKKLAPGTALYTLPNMVSPAGQPATGPASTMTGSLQEAEQTFRAAAADYMVPISDAAAAQLVTQALSSGTTDIATFAKTYFQAQAKSLYPTMAAAIDAGITPKAYTDPYRQTVANLLGVSPDSINMNDPKYLRFVTQKDPKTGLPTAMSLYDTQQLVMSDPTYGYMKSHSAADRASALVQGLGEMFGKTPSVPSGFSGVQAPAV